MADKKYAGENGLSAIFAQIKAAIAGKADVGVINSISEDVGELQEDVSGLQDDLTNVNDEIIVYRKRFHGGDLWAGDTLTFNNVSASSNVVYHFMAFDTTASGTPESAYLIVKTTGVQTYGKVGTFTTTYDAEHNILTITLPSSSYWDYRFEVAARRND